MNSGILAAFFDSPFSVGALIFCIPIVGIVAYYWADVQKNRDNAELKQSMVERGMSAQEIERVMNAGTQKEEKQEELRQDQIDTKVM